MKFARKSCVVVLTAVLVLGLFSGIRADAAETDTLKISLKYINSKTGVKITIGKTPGADAYMVLLKGYGDSYTGYQSDDVFGHQVAVIDKNGKAKRTYRINGLAKGTYSIQLVALKEETNGQVYYQNKYYNKTNYSAEKTFKIKAPKKIQTEEKSYDFSKAKVGDTITFGAYEQDGIMTNGKEDIEWVVLSKNDSQMLVMSKYALDCLPYNTDFTDITWENCSLRKWLNSNFYKTAFTKAERKLIKKTKLENADNPDPDRGTEGKGGNDTIDNVFLLSLDDMINTEYGFTNGYVSNEKETYFRADIARRCAATAYAVTKGAYTTERFKGGYGADLTADNEYTCLWWLRSPASFGSNGASYVYYDGSVDVVGNFVNDNIFSVRPSLYINLQP